MAEERKTLYVRALKGLNHRDDPTTHVLQFLEEDDAHPQGRALVAGPDPVEVGDTAGVRAALKAGTLEEVPASEFKAYEKAKQDAYRLALGQDEKMRAQQANDIATARNQLQEEIQKLAADRAAFEQEKEQARADLEAERAKLQAKK